MTGRASKQKGSRVERQIVALHRDMGISAKRVPLSGAAAGYKGDIIIGLPDGSLQGEIKSRKNGTGFNVIDGWLGENDILFLKRNNRKPAVYMSWSTYQRLMELINNE